LNQDEPARSTERPGPALVAAAARIWTVGIAIAALLGLAWYASETSS